ncbi:triose-phosphate isomerase [Pelosinus propionicus]|uniref:Triosephosphate isomerase n=1 Tax=Pelosinus propionicus DSM 13327 TaxID=1123291 RepID=A0A1I4M4E6_9FIRM|nr:triose-phosphate isomerase [Pelosinus propionicus]SFL97867.1 triosephosphate isomerase [Pelosinus propionicus DSM 13327]
MKKIFVNLKRFDVPKDMGGICTKDNPKQWIEWIVEESVKNGLGKLNDIEVIFLLPEGLAISAIEKLATYSASAIGSINIGIQGVFREDVEKGVNFGAFTTNLPAAAAKNMGCTWSIIGHSEERKDKLGIIAKYDSEVLIDMNKSAAAKQTVNAIINQEVHCALNAGLKVLVCLGETAEEKGEGEFEVQKPRIKSVLKKQLEQSLRGVEAENLTESIAIGYEPIWAIGPGKIPPGAEYIDFVSSFIKEIVYEILGFDPVVVYGGGLKEENAKMISKIGSLGGGLVALTRFSGDIGFYPEELAKIIEQYKE